MKIFAQFKRKIDILFYRLSILIHKFLIKIDLPICEGWEHPCFKKGKLRRQNTQYVDDKINFVFLCDECMKANDEHWNGMWSDYYRGCL